MEIKQYEIENEKTTLFRTVVVHRGRKFIYMKPVTFKLWNDPQQERRVKEAVNKVLFGLNIKYSDECIHEPFDDDESIEDKYAAVDDAINMLENMVKYGTIDKPKDADE